MVKTRREFIKKGTIIAGGLSLGLTAGCTPFRLAEYTLEDDRIKVSKSQFVDDPFVVIKVKSYPTPIYIGKLEDGYSALLMQCTHKRCTVRPTGTILQCPCHGSEYNNKGEVIEPPAEKNLKPFRVTQDEEHVYIY